MRLKELNEGDSVISYDYDPHGRIASRKTGNGSRTDYSYDKQGRLSTLTNLIHEQVIDKIDYRYDMSGNIISMERQRSGFDEDSGIISYDYDALGRVKDVRRDGVTVRSYEYDSFGNRTGLSHEGGRIRYEYNAANQLICKKDGLTEETYKYDKRGNLIETLANGETVKEMIYGPFGRLEKAWDSHGESIEYTYNGLDHRVGETGISGRIEYLTDITRDCCNLLNVKSKDKNQTILWNGMLPVAISDGDQDSVWNHIMGDHLGSPMRYLDDKGELIESYGFDEFGNDHSTNPEAYAQPFGFTGYTKDTVAGLYYAQARQYILRRRHHQRESGRACDAEQIYILLQRPC